MPRPRPSIARIGDRIWTCGLYDGAPCTGRGLSCTAATSIVGHAAPHDATLGCAGACRPLPYLSLKHSRRCGRAAGTIYPLTSKCTLRQPCMRSSASTQRGHPTDVRMRPLPQPGVATRWRVLAVQSHRPERVHQNRNGQRWPTQLLKVFTKVTAQEARATQHPRC
jgi:hypothetical protein